MCVLLLCDGKPLYSVSVIYVDIVDCVTFCSMCSCKAELHIRQILLDYCQCFWHLHKYVWGRCSNLNLFKEIMKILSVIIQNINMISQGWNVNTRAKRLHCTSASMKYWVVELFTVNIECFSHSVFSWVYKDYLDFSHCTSLVQHSAIVTAFQLSMKQRVVDHMIWQNRNVRFGFNMCACILNYNRWTLCYVFVLCSFYSMGECSSGTGSPGFSRTNSTEP